jgi:hypothetical protein
MGKVIKKRISKETPRRIYKFLKEKPEPSEFKDAYKSLLAFLDKASKGVGQGAPEEEAE